MTSGFFSSTFYCLLTPCLLLLVLSLSLIFSSILNPSHTQLLCGFGSSIETSILFASSFELGIISGSTKTGGVTATGRGGESITLSGSGALKKPCSLLIVYYEKKISATSANLMLAETWLRRYYFYGSPSRTKN